MQIRNRNSKTRHYQQDLQSTAPDAVNQVQDKKRKSISPDNAGFVEIGAIRAKQPGSAWH